MLIIDYQPYCFTVVYFFATLFSRNAFTSIDYSLYQESGQWYILKSEAQLDLFQSTSLHTDLYFPAINYHIYLQRNPFYNIIYMALPSFILCLVSLLRIWRKGVSADHSVSGIFSSDVFAFR